MTPDRLPGPPADHLDPDASAAGGRRGCGRGASTAAEGPTTGGPRRDPHADRRLRRHTAASRAFPDIVEIVVEIPRGSRNKYEFDEEAGVFRLDRVLSSAVYYNFDYGFIEGPGPTTATTPTRS